MSLSQSVDSESDLITATVKSVRAGLAVAMLLSCIVNLLMLTSPLFMLQIYDRVLVSRSVPTLLTLFGLVVALYTMMAIFDFLRARILSRVAHWMDLRLALSTFNLWIERHDSVQAAGYKPVTDLTIVRGFIGSPAFVSIFELPWFPFYLAIVFILHTYLGLLAAAGFVMLTAVAVANEALTGEGVQRAAAMEMAETRLSDEVMRNAESILAMGMTTGVTTYWKRLREQALATMQTVTERAEFLTALSKALRILLQSAMLALGAWLVIRQELSAGAIVAASIISGRALAPIDQCIGGWKQIKRGRLAWQRLKAFISSEADRPTKAIVTLPQPAGHIELDDVTKLAPGGADRPAILNSLSLALNPGDGLGVIGPSASGKSSLARLLTGVWLPDHGTLRIDGATFDQWGGERINQYIGYLPQSFGLISGTIAQNIARFDSDAQHDDIIEAARMAGVHEMILSFPDGYATRVDHGLTILTGGQCQRIALARAVFRKPKLVVLDEPNSNLDAEGDEALKCAILALRDAGCVVVVMTHRPSALSAVNKLLLLKNGQTAEFGDRSEMLQKLTRAA